MASLYSVTYNTNNSTGGTTPPTQSATSDSTSYSFIAPTPDQYGLIKTNYGFAGWSEDPNAATAQYAPGSTIELSSTSPSKTLYAVWQPGLMLITNMQDMTLAGCKEGTNIGDTKQLVDTRKNTDGNTRTYWVAKLKDGNCWMTQNLDYDDQEGIRVTSTGGTNGGPSSGDWKDDNAVRQYWDPGEKIVSGSKLAAASDDTDQHLLVGNYYSWLSATNGTGSDVTTNGDNASGSICPEGWKLPLSGSSNGLNANAASGSFGKMINSQLGITNTNTADTNLLKDPLYFVRGGRVYNGSLNNAGSTGYYWSSTSASSTTAYGLYFNSSNVSPSSSHHRYLGYSVRCVAR